MIGKGLFFSSTSFLIGFSVFVFDFTTMPTFDAHALEMLIALAMAAASFVITIAIVRVVPVVRVVRVVPIAPSRAGRRQVKA
jgi:hypothetical protein